MKIKYLSTIHFYKSVNKLFRLAFAMLIVLITFFAGTNQLSAQTGQMDQNNNVNSGFYDLFSTPEANQNISGLKIYTDEKGNKVMRTTPLPKNSNNPAYGNTFYITPEIYPSPMPFPPPEAIVPAE